MPFSITAAQGRTLYNQFLAFGVRLPWRFAVALLLTGAITDP
jgi:hypothetical protein